MGKKYNFSINDNGNVDNGNINRKRTRRKKNADLENVVSSKGQTVSLRELYRYNRPIDTLLLMLAILMSLCIGVAVPLNIWTFKDVINLVINPPKDTKFQITLAPYILNFGIIAVCTFVAGFIQAVCVSQLGQRVGFSYKTKFYEALLRQDIKWYDKQQTGRLITKITDDIETIETAITDKLVQFIQQIATFVASIVVAFVSYWKLTFIALTALPLMIILFFVVFRLIKKYAIAQIQAYSVAGGIAEEILSGLKTVIAFNAQETEVERYAENLKKAEKLGIKKTICQGIAAGSIGLIIWSVGSLVFYMGLKFYDENDMQPGKIILVFFNVVLGSLALANSIPQTENIIQATAAGYPLFQIIDNTPDIDIRKEGTIPESFEGDIGFKNINFEYPARPEVPILKNFNFTIPQGKTVAFIGPSGSGKSTIIHLLQRLYDPDSGEVTLNSTDIKKLDIKWYRSKVGVVQQEPPLFNGTVEENIRLGKLDATYEEIEEAAKKSNAYDFIMDTKLKFQTQLGDLGSGFSGGQKQRIAIATALISSPSLLLLDEATSALDNESERLVQATIDQNICNQGNVTVVMVAHRLRTVRNADVIVVMKSGEIIEQGNHDELIELKGLYYEMLMKQQKGEEKDVPQETELDKLEESIALETSKRYSRTFSAEEFASLTTKTHYQTFKDFVQLIKLNEPEKYYLIFGIIVSILVGILYPCASIIYSEMFQIFTYKTTDHDKFKSQGNLFCGLLLIPAICLFFFFIIKNACFGKSGECLTTRLRKLMMASMLNQEIAWFDDPQNQPGILVGRLALEASLVKGAAGSQIGIFIEAGSNLLTAMIIGFYYSWELSMLFFLLIPMITISGIIQGRNVHGGHGDTETQMDKEGSEGGRGPIALVLESLNNIRRVQSLNLQDYFHENHIKLLNKYNKNKHIKLFLYGIFAGVGVCAIYLSFCCVFLLGGYLLDERGLAKLSLMRVFSCLNMSSSALGRALALSPDVEKARISTRKTLSTIYRQSTIDPSNSTGIIPPSGNFNGNIKLIGVRFRYPTRPNIPVLRGFTYEIEANKIVALVGHSGCGKSTIIQLLLRFYDSIQLEDCGVSGSIVIDGFDIKTLNLKWLRSKIGLVQQEPTLFNVSVTDNIVLGSEGPINKDRVAEVARMANIDEFVKNLPQAYDTKVGQRGGHLSGGQKQRICIARALYRQPSLLLLDEATSALDTESESLVQKALGEASKGRTCISIAHRLSSIRDFADSIVVLEKGTLIESGSHDELMQISHGKYQALYSGTIC